MTEEEIILIWLGIVSLIGLNGFSAGVIALLRGWAPRSSKAASIAISVASAGFLPASMFIPMAFSDREFILGDGPLIATVAFLMVMALGMLISLPGAIAVARRPHAASPEFRVFE